MCTLNLLEGVKYIVTQRTHFNKCCQFRDWCIKSHNIHIDLFNPIMQNKKLFLADSMTLLYELCIYPSTKSKNNTQVAGPSIISAFGEKFKIRIILFMYLSPPTFDNWGGSWGNWQLCSSCNASSQLKDLAEFYNTVRTTAFRGERKRLEVIDHFCLLQDLFPHPSICRLCQRLVFLSVYAQHVPILKWK